MATKKATMKGLNEPGGMKGFLGVLPKPAVRRAFMVSFADGSGARGPFVGIGAALLYAEQHFHHDWIIRPLAR
jgi:hypothetical protein